MSFEKRVESIQLPQPYSLQPTGNYEGNDGLWSTFFININSDSSGKNGQNFRVLISTSSGITLVPQRTNWCTTDSCADSRGIMQVGGSQSLGFDNSNLPWKSAGIYEIPRPRWWTPGLISNSNETESAVWGVDNVGLGLSSPTSEILAEQHVVMYPGENFWLGSFGLAAGSSGAQTAEKPNFLTNYYQAAHRIPSLSYGYTAGAHYRNNNGVLGSLTLGGFDSARLADPGTSIEMPNENNHTLAVYVNSMMYRPDQAVDPSAISLTSTSKSFRASIDSTLPYLILPDSVCDEFALRFALEYNDEWKLFTMNDSSHAANLQQNAAVSIKISADPSDSIVFTEIVLPYSAFDLSTKLPPTTNFDNETRYFPIKRSENSDFVLGRTFLQEAYIIVDYERFNFTVAPAAFPDPSKKDLKPIFNTTYSPITSYPESKSGLSAGAIAGIVVGIVVAFILAGIGAFLFWKKRRATKKKLLEDGKPSEIDTTFAGTEVKHRRISELTGSEGPQSPKDSTGYYHADHKSIPPISEMSPESTPAELYSPPPDNRDTIDYFAAGRMRRRGATKDRDSSANNSPRTPIAELPGDDAKPLSLDKQHDGISSIQKPPHSRSPSNTSLSMNIDEVLANKQTKEPKTSTEETYPSMKRGDPVTAEELASAKSGAQFEDAEQADHSTMERRPSHTRGLSETTVQSESTAVSQPTPEELERWARSVDDGPARPMSP